MMPARVEPCFDIRMKISPGRPSSYSPTVTKPLQSATRNSKVREVRLRGSFSRTGTLMTFSTIFSTISRPPEPPRPRALVRRRLLLGHRQRLGHLAVVAVDGDGLDAHLPGVDVELLDLLDGGLLGHVHGLGDGARDERLDRRHHPHVARVVDGVVAHRAGEHRHVLGGEVWRADDRLVLVDVGDDLVDLAPAS